MTNTHLDLSHVPVDRPLLFSDERTITYGEFFSLVLELRQKVTRDLAVIVARNDIERIVSYLACFYLDVPILLVEENIDAASLEEIAIRFNAKYIVGGKPTKDFQEEAFSVAGEPWLERTLQTSSPIHRELALMLATSGSTGNPKFVRLSRNAVLSNAFSIATGLGVLPTDRAITSLPFSYTYGLSVINSHFVQGATICVCSQPMISAEFWRTVEKFTVTNIAGVPTNYGILRKMRWSPGKYPSLRYMTQAGGRLKDSDRSFFLELLDRNGVAFYVMYGQTEATARITITPPGDLREHISTAGRVIDGGNLRVGEPDEKGIGIIIYSGPNVMMGYADTSEDLARGDEMGGVLETGDLGYLNDGLLFLTGRTKRIVKIFGVRVSLDDIDTWLCEFGSGVSVQGDDCVVLFMEQLTAEAAHVRHMLSEHLHVHATGIKVVVVEDLPTLSSGKIDFQTLTKMALEQ